MSSTSIELLPNPRRMIEGLRDTGYQFNTAIADIVDNSIAAEATLVELTIEMDYRGNVRIAITDNGTGMDRDGLLNAMRYGSDRRPNPASLGKFGLGLKTASTAFCRRLSLISRVDGKAAPLQATWDLDHVAKQGKWDLLLSEKADEEALDLLNKVAPAKSGTVVLWTKIDRLFSREYRDAGGGHAQNALTRTIAGLKEHLAMVYQRFLDPNDKRAPALEIRLNGERVHAWDPFCEGVADLVGNETVPTETDTKAEFTVRAFILPRKEEFTSEAAARNAKLSNERQGLYIYRENRLIHDADWLGMFSKEPHGSLLRVEFSFDHRLDEAFHIDIKKSQIILNEDLWNWLKDEFLTAPRREANNRYRQGQRIIGRKQAQGSHDRSNQNIASKEDEIRSADVTVNNSETGEVLVTNKQGTFKLKLRVERALRPGEVFVQPVDGLDDGALFSPAIIDGHKAVKINTSHPYYHKVYMPNLTRGVTIQGMDSLLWGLCVAELSTISDVTVKHFEEMRFEVSRILRKLVEDLPEPEVEASVAA
jgi:hypothetical protein